MKKQIKETWVYLMKDLRSGFYKIGFLGMDANFVDFLAEFGEII